MTYQTNEPCTACGTTSVQRTYHHLKTRGAGGTDDPWNLMPLCLEHHNEVHRSLVKLADKFENVKQWLENNKWEICHLMNRWTRPKV